MGTALEAASARGAPASSGMAGTGYRSDYYDERCEETPWREEGLGVAGPALLLALIHRSAWKVNSQKLNF